uniref:Uncharacterized protein n=1 Tax=Oryza meridionalis TaxID=40149 RepID=A0A0E0ETC0_9ORYZ
MSASASADSSSSMLRPSLSIRWILVPKVLGSSRLKPEVRRAVSKSSITRSFTDLSFLSASARLRSSSMMAFSGSFTDLSFLSASARLRSSSMMAFSGLISMVFLLDM